MRSLRHFTHRQTARPIDPLLTPVYPTRISLVEGINIEKACFYKKN